MDAQEIQTIMKHPTSAFVKSKIAGGVEYSAVRFKAASSDELGLAHADNKRVAEMFTFAQSLGCVCNITKYGSISITVKSEEAFRKLESQFSDVIEQADYTPARMLTKYDESLGLGKAGGIQFYDNGEDNAGK